MKKFSDLVGSPDIAIISVPRRMDFGSAIAFSEQLANVAKAETYIFDFTQTNFVRPFAMLLVASAILQFKSRRKGSIFQAHNFQHSGLRYAAHMGFFKLIGLKYGKDPGEADGSSSYQGITVLSVQDIKNRANSEMVDPGDVVDHDARALARVLSRQESGEVVEALTYSIREMIRNVVEHSKSETVRYCAQYWPGLDEVEIGIADTGVGLRQTLSRNPNLQMNDDEDAVKFAVWPGISGAAWKGIKPKKQGVWQNSGYGLFMTSRLCNDFGSFFLCSGKSGLFMGPGNRQYISTDLEGTAVMLVLRTKDLTDVQGTLKKYRDEGTKLAKALQVAHAFPPSSASVMLSSYFKNKK